MNFLHALKNFFRFFQSLLHEIQHHFLKQLFILLKHNSLQYDYYVILVNFIRNIDFLSYHI